MIDTGEYERMDLEGLTKQDLIEILKGSDPSVLLAELKRVNEQLDRYTQFVLWVEEEHNEVFDEYEGKDEL